MRFCPRFLSDISGNFATITAIVAPVLLGAAGLATDFAQYYSHREGLQEITDTAALAGTEELMLAGTSDDQVKAVVKAYVESNLEDEKLGTSVSVVTDIDRTDNTVKVDVSFVWHPMFAHYVNKKTTPIETTSTAKLAGEGLTCVIGLMPPQRLARASIHMDNDSRMQADNCSVYSNSTSRYGLRVDDSAQMVAESICSAGGIFRNGKSADFTPEPLVDCPKVKDPLVNRLAPVIGSCDHTDLVFGFNTGEDELTLAPGTYCGGISIGGSAKVTLSKGIYIIKDGPLVVAGEASLTGTEASFYLTGENSEFDFQADTTIDLSATKTGKLAGLLFYEDRNVSYSFSFNPFDLGNLPEDVRLHKISSNNAHNLLGTLYLKRSLLLINANAAVADKSPYTAIVVGRLWLQDGPTLYLNADYTTTQVPVPGGLIGKRPILVK